MITGFLRANKENILYTVLTIFLLERVRRGWNRIAARSRAANEDAGTVERRQQTFMFVAALLYALPFVLPVVRYVYRSFDELSGYVGGLSVLSSIWTFALVVMAVELFLAIVIYNLLGIYVERMNSALGFFRKIGRSVADGSRVAVKAGDGVRTRVSSGIRGATVDGVRAGQVLAQTTRQVVRRPVGILCRSARRCAAGGGRLVERGLRRAARPLARRIA